MIQSLYSLFNNVIDAARIAGVHNVLEKFLKMLEFGIKTSRLLKVLENR